MKKKANKTLNVCKVDSASEREIFWTHKHNKWDSNVNDSEER